MSKHTPGPWHTSPCSHGGLIVIREGISQSHVQIVPEADARLFAAAPALADALRELHDILALYLRTARSRRGSAEANGSRPRRARARRWEQAVSEPSRRKELRLMAAHEDDEHMDAPHTDCPLCLVFSRREQYTREQQARSDLAARRARRQR
jgi:hypothetical protein